MTKPASALYSCKLVDIETRIEAHISLGCEQSEKPPLVFFRADDIGIPSVRFQQLIKCFKRYSLPLCLATVPAWTTKKRLSALQQETGRKNETISQWYWHQHGHVHRNFETSGKNQEFGEARSKQKIQASLEKGRTRLEQLLGNSFNPLFTPPWNRCSEDTLQALVELQFQGVSRSKGAKPQAPDQLPDFQVNVDLHTRKESDPHLAANNLLAELEQSLASGLCGIMIHHQRMNGAALDLLDLLLSLISRSNKVIPVHFGDLLKQ